MEYTDFKRFIFENKIKQSFLAKYLGVTEGYISNVAGGRKELSKGNLGKLLNNPYGWDVSMLTQSENPMTDEPKEDAFIAHLKQEIADLKATIEQLQNERCDLREEIGTLKKEVQLARKGEIASIVVGSSDASAG